MFVADDLGAWLIGLLADAARKRLLAAVLGSAQERALHQAAAAAIAATVQELSPAGDERAGQLAMVIGEVFQAGAPGTSVPVGRHTLLEMLQRGIAEQLAVLDDASLTDTGQSSAELLGVSGEAAGQVLSRHLLGEIALRGSAGGPLAPLASQLNHDLTHLQGQRVEGLLAQLIIDIQAARSEWQAARKPVRLAQRPVFMAGREDLLDELSMRLSGGGHRHDGAAWRAGGHAGAQLPCEDVAVLLVSELLATACGTAGRAFPGGQPRSR